MTVAQMPFFCRSHRCLLVALMLTPRHRPSITSLYSNELMLPLYLPKTGYYVNQISLSDLSEKNVCWDTHEGFLLFTTRNEPE